jgi:phenylalanyl-tRNA synthetase beta subunit
VDITNYVMLDHGRPAHAYDIAKLHGGLVARAANSGEKVLALNEKEYSLEPFVTVIADDREVHDIGGIMGGEDSGVSETTTDVMLEIAYFTPERIARTGQALGLTSDARSRFERGVDPGFLDDGLAILTFAAANLRRRCTPESHRSRGASSASIMPGPKLSAESTCRNSGSAKSSRASVSRSAAIR